jgi:hypothetical protein
MAENSSDPSTPQGKRGGTRKAATFDQERVVRRYLSAVESSRPGRGTKRTADAIGNRITKVDELLVSADPLVRVHLTQERIELHAEYVRVTNGNNGDQSHFERDFVRVARSYGDRNGITYAAWRQVGVDAAVLERAGIHKAEKKPPPAAVRAAEQAAGGEAPQPVASAPTPPDEAETKAPAAEAPIAAATGEEPTHEPAEAVSMDELAALLADASIGASSSNSSTQPSLGDELNSAADDPSTPAPGSPRRPTLGEDNRKA